MDQLDLLLKKAESYSNFILENQKQSSHQPALPPAAEETGGKRSSPRGKGPSKSKQQKLSFEDKVKSSKHTEEAVGTGGGAFKQPPNLVGGKLLPYQLDGLKWLLSLFENGLSGILADEMGLGKTIQIISLIAHLRTVKTGGPFLIAGPLAVTENWVSEFKKWLPDQPVLLYHASKADREVLRNTKMQLSKQKDLNFPVIVTSFEMCIIDRPHLEKYNWQYLILDEGHRIKNRNCRLIRSLKLIPSVSRLLLTGTPIQNSLEELWSLLNFVAPVVFDDIETFRSWFDFKNIGKETSIEDVIEEQQQQKIVTKLHEIMRPFVLRRVKREVLGNKIPPKKEIVVYCGMSSLQREYYSMVLNNSIRDSLVAAGVDNAKNVSQINMCMNLRKVCNHPFLFGDIKDPSGGYISETNPRLLAMASGKFRLLDRMLPKLHKAGSKVLIFSQMTELLNILEDYLIGKKYVFVRFDGSTPRELRQEYIDRFNADDTVFVFLLSTRAGGQGVNLTAADTCILFDSDWNPHQDKQAQDRCHRIGQQKPVVTYRFLTSGSVEIDIMKKQMSKNKLARLTITGGDYRNAGVRRSKQVSVEDLRQLLTDDVQNLDTRERSDDPENVLLSQEISEDELDHIMDRAMLFDMNSALYKKREGSYVKKDQVHLDSESDEVMSILGDEDKDSEMTGSIGATDEDSGSPVTIGALTATLSAGQSERKKKARGSPVSAGLSRVSSAATMSEASSVPSDDGEGEGAGDKQADQEQADIKVRFAGDMYDIISTGTDEIFMSIEH